MIAASNLEISTSRWNHFWFLYDRQLWRSSFYFTKWYRCR